MKEYMANPSRAKVIMAKGSAFIHSNGVFPLRPSQSHEINYVYEV